ncbi:MAG: T9SS type A sorting domain-containing protein [Candidatus Marinimicrobia bacterium]|nr:T9SS type A sorting domain-containing protein [Candidatus Neomarinimicrobiota bacterium]
MKKMLTIMVMLSLVSGLTYAQSYVGSPSCQICHSEKYNDWNDSGHPYKFSVIENNQAPIYPDFVTNFQSTWLTNLGDGSLDWSNIAGVIGGFGWKARFVGTDGIIVGTASSTLPGAGGGHNQFNFFGGEEHGWVDYSASTTNKLYNYSCFKCHTTGGDTTGTWLPGVEGLGTFTEGGVGCEGCHGPGSNHVQTGGDIQHIDRVYEYAHLDNSIGGLDINGVVQTPSATSDDVTFLCGTCHNRSYTSPINSSSGFIKHHEQWDEFVSSNHSEQGFNCTTCHDPHKRVIWDGDAITTTCETCHSTQVGMTNHNTNATCVDCHMPFAAKSGTTRGESGYMGDVRSHLLAITVDAESMFTEDGSAVRDDETRSASLSPAYSCLGCHNDDPTDAIPEMDLDQVVNLAANMHAAPVDDPTYVGSPTCSVCHTEKYNDWNDSGHPYKFSVIENNQAPIYPDFVTNFQSTWLTNLGDGSLDWSNIAGVIGGFGWKARFVGTDGIIVGTASSTLPGAGGGHNQFNFFGGEEHGWVDYSASTTNKLYNYSCFKCHTTGGDTTGTWLPGVEGLGTFTEGGVGCEGCHGPGSNHVQTGGDIQHIDRVYEYAHLDNSIGGLDINGVVQTPSATSDDVTFLCGTCHNRSYTSPINSSSGFIKHHEQWDEFVSSNHSEQGFNCTTCHDPHKRVIWDGDAITTTCETCHSTQVGMTNHNTNATCVDCHMPFAAKSGTTRGESGYMGDVRSHLLAITVDAESMFTEDGSAVRDDETRSASLSPAYSCLGCHNDDPTDAILDKTLAEAVVSAANMHGAVSTVQDNTIPAKFNLAQNYPNPFNPTTTIDFSLQKESDVRVVVYDLIGKQIATLVKNTLGAGNYQLRWNGTTDNGTPVPAGVYFTEMTTPEFNKTIKMVYLK